jgi:RES domain-containing protein
VHVYRLCRAPFVALDGEGARLYGGRWNAPGLAVVYASSSRALAALEYLAHVDVMDVPGDLTLLTMDVPDAVAVERVEPVALPDDWVRVPGAPACRDLGDAWAAARRTLVLRVPAVPVPEEENVLLNPRHPDMTSVRVVARRPFSFDERVLRSIDRRR